MAKRVLTLSSFPEKFFEIWREAAANNLRLDFPSKGYATNFKQRLHQFRNVLVKEGSPEGSIFYQADIHVVENEDGTAYLESYVPDWKKQFDAAPKKGTELAPPQMPEATVKEPNAMEDALAKLGFGSKN